ncbi:MAG: hypothetical protein M1144_04965 [Candidatus Thermoplasmatota archaeon]|jgi:hypothetical protein|nr:hypothetical protein [Candidatus Thermoplasmatota archaeon]
MDNRRTYLLVRLKNGQITLEEARELFQAMNTDIRALQEQIGMPPPPPPSGESASEGPSPRSASPPSGPTLSLEELLLIIGPMAGIFAALQKKSRERV